MICITSMGRSSRSRCSKSQRTKAREISAILLFPNAPPSDYLLLPRRHSTTTTKVTRSFTLQDYQSPLPSQLLPQLLINHLLLLLPLTLSFLLRRYHLALDLNNLHLLLVNKKKRTVVVHVGLESSGRPNWIKNQFRYFDLTTLVSSEVNFLNSSRECLLGKYRNGVARWKMQVSNRFVVPLSRKKHNTRRYFSLADVRF